MRFRQSWTAILVFTLFIATNAQRPKSRPRSVKPDPPTKGGQVTGRSGTTVIATRRPFDPSVDRLPPHFAGHDIKALYIEMSTRSTDAKKGEFETTEEFRARVQKDSMAPVLGGLDKDGFFAFKLTNSSGEIIYDADQRMMTIAVQLSNASKDIYTPSNKKGLTSQFELSKETYDGSNAMGAKVTVTRKTSKQYEVAISNYSNFGVSRYINSETRARGHTSNDFANDVILIPVPMEIDTARRVKGHLEIIAIVRLREPYTFEGTFYHKPTFQDPTELFVQYYYLNSELLELWIYDNTTGQVFVRKKPN